MRPWWLLAVGALSACDSEVPVPVVVYAPAEFEEQLHARLANSDFAVTVIAGNSAEITGKVISKQDSPRADVLITSNAMDIWHAADEGALRPIDEESLAEVPAALVDPDGAWVALDHRQVLIGVAPGTDPVASLMELGAPGAAGHLCLTSFGLAANQALVALLIDELGVKPAERLVRSWVRNLAAAPFPDELQLLAALQKGDCEFGIVSGIPDGSSVSSIVPQPGYLLIDGIGISRHAENADAAQGLVRMLLSGYQAGELQGSAASNAGIAGWRNEEARLLAERVGYR